MPLSNPLRRVQNLTSILGIVAVTALIYSPLNLAVPYCQREITARHPHPDMGSTQGFIIDQGIVFESSGGYDKSWLGKYKLGQRHFLTKKVLNKQEFAEGLALQNDQLVQLTWKAGTAHQYHAETMAPLTDFSYQGEGWGLTYDRQHLIQSDGSSFITFRDPQNFIPSRRLQLTDDDIPVDDINELEWVEGLLYANVWHKDWFGIFNPQNGQLLCKIDMKKAVTLEQAKGGGVLNGIAYDQTSQKLYVTGKNWRTIYEVKIQSIPDK